VVVVMVVAGTDGLFMLIDAGLWAEITMILHFAPHVFKKSKTDLPCGSERTPFPYYLADKKAFSPLPQIQCKYPLLIHGLLNDAFSTSD
jgi:hypothetical protein